MYFCSLDVQAVGLCYEGRVGGGRESGDRDLSRVATLLARKQVGLAVDRTLGRNGDF